MQEREPFAVQAARFSLWAPIVLVLLNIVARALGVGEVILMVGVLALVGYPAGLILGIIALCGIPKHGKQGILVRGILGITLNGLILLLVVAMIPILGSARAKAREVRDQGASAMGSREEAEAAYRFRAPTGFQLYSEEGDSSSDRRETYIKGNLLDAEPDIILEIESLGGLIKQEDLSAMVASQPHVKLLKEEWKTHQIDVFEVRETTNGMMYLTYNAQIPLQPAALQLKVAGPAERQDELRLILRQALDGTYGLSNWD